MIEDFCICHWCQRHRWCTLSCEYLSEFSKKIWNGPNGILTLYGGPLGIQSSLELGKHKDIDNWSGHKTTKYFNDGICLSFFLVFILCVIVTRCSLRTLKNESCDEHRIRPNIAEGGRRVSRRGTELSAIQTEGYTREAGCRVHRSARCHCKLHK